jgi:hypothetical protein
MRISRIEPTDVVPVPQRAPRASSAQPLSQSRALVPVEPVAPRGTAYPPMRHPAAPFIAQLLATRMRMPQTRARRRAEPEVAIAAYRAMMGA